MQQYLGPGETLVWSGRPRQGVFLRGNDLFLVPFSLFWGGFVVFWESSVIRSGAPVFFMLWGIPFIFMGFYLVVGRFFFDAWQRSQTGYAVTNERVIISRGGLSPSLTTLEGRSLANVTMDTKADGSGTITFGDQSFVAGMYAGMAWPGMKRVPCFDTIPDVKKVYDIVRAVQKGDSLTAR